MRFVCERCGEGYEHRSPYASADRTSDFPIGVQTESREPESHVCRLERDDEPGSLFDAQE